MDVFIGNLSPRTTQSDLVSFFKGFASAARFQIFDKQFEDGSRTRYAIATLDPDKLALKAIRKFSGQYLKGNLVTLREYHHRSSNNERRALGWRERPWHGVERRDLERRRKQSLKPVDFETEMGLKRTPPGSERPAEPATIKIEARSLFARKH